ncbi:MAG: hypothetical protein Q4D68_05210 [Moraxella equi]|nr:hypothetical protein [Moraxella equi]
MMYGFWERYYQNSIFSSNNKCFDLFRILCLFGALLVFPSIYIKVGMVLTVLFIILSALLVFGLLKYLGEDIENAIKSFLLTAFIMLIFFTFTILADALKFLYILCTLFFLFVQDWCYRIGHKIFNDDNFNCFVRNGVFTEFKILSFVSFLSYITMFIFSIYFSYSGFDGQVYESLKMQRIDIFSNKNFFAQISNNEFSLQMQFMNWWNGKKQAITAIKNLFGRLGVIFTIIGFVSLCLPLISSLKNE